MKWFPKASAGRIVLFVTVPLMVLFLLATVGWALEEYGQRQEEARLNAEIAQLKQRYQELERQEEYLKSDEYIEETAREELGLIKEGEKAVLVLPAPPTPTPVVTPTPVAKDASESPWSGWLRSLFGR